MRYVNVNVYVKCLAQCLTHSESSINCTCCYYYEYYYVYYDSSYPLAESKEPYRCLLYQIEYNELNDVDNYPISAPACFYPSATSFTPEPWAQIGHQRSSDLTRSSLWGLGPCPNLQHTLPRYCVWSHACFQMDFVKNFLRINKNVYALYKM